MNKELTEKCEDMAGEYAWGLHPRTSPQLKAGLGYVPCVADYKAGMFAALSLEIVSKIPEVAALIDAARLCRLYCLGTDATTENMVIKFDKALLPFNKELGG